MAIERGQTIPPGSTIGILGDGQLGRMSALAAANLGYRCHIYAPAPGGPASEVAAATTVGAYTDEAALARFAAACDVVSFEFENIPFEGVRFLAERVLVRPHWEVLRTAQDRRLEKEFLNRAGVATTAFRAVHGPDEVAEAARALGRPAILKTCRLGYDGKGQVRIEAATDPAHAWRTMGAAEGVLEAFVDFVRELSVVVARGLDGRTVAFDTVENRHVHHILDTTTAPAPIPPARAAEAQAIARRIAEAFDLVGLLAVELFETREGRLLVNELAPRPHNSGHWTMDACVTSQFEQFVRAVCGLPLGSTERLADAVMTNLLGDAAAGWEAALREPAAKLHLYGKREARPGRKMGHITRLYPKGSLPTG